jgi:hypothetical protein
MWGQSTVRRVQRAASETTSMQPAAQPETPDRPASATTPQDGERVPALGRAALSIPHFLYAYFSLVLVLVYPNLLSLTTISPRSRCLLSTYPLLARSRLD